ncbi:unnamed protein product [Vitrella brassicaformis CCMP3155]|uniref:RAP domain-containing protein n=3 Tax=Vitrella brassicaformis TaxID=1169539 RepID=A0A0G4F5A4_VITBC|nr:unnamed protein product [Vitrella brassicaformis CCMP3155]|eukprot:CEM07025.1 unnamed protein product [Vitrella brassicaformis CCMP3155]
MSAAVRMLPARRPALVRKDRKYYNAITNRMTRMRDVDELLQLIDQHFGDFNSVHVVAALHKLARAVSDGRDGHVSAVDRLKSDEVFVRLVERLRWLLQRSSKFLPRHLSNAAWALARLGVRDDELYELLSRQAIGRLRKFQPQEMSNMLWAYATIGQRDPALVYQMYPFLARELSRAAFAPQELANTLWALTTLGMADTAFLLDAADAITKSFDQYRPMDIATILWSFAAVGGLPPTIFPAIARAAVVRAEAVVKQTGAGGGQFSGQDCSLMVWACAQAGIQEHDRDVLDGIVKVARGRLGTFSDQALANFVWGLAVLDHHDLPLFSEAFREVERRVRDGLMASPKHRQQIFWAHLSLMLDERIDEGQRGAVAMDERLLERFRESFMGVSGVKGEGGEKLFSSSLHQAVSLALSRFLKVEHQNEYWIRNAIVVDIAMPERKVALEVDGPFHYQSLGLGQSLQDPDTPPQITPKTLFKRRILKQLGWKVTSIPYFEWHALRSRKDKEEYVKQRFLDIGVDITAPPDIRQEDDSQASAPLSTPRRPKSRPEVLAAMNTAPAAQQAPSLSPHPSPVDHAAPPHDIQSSAASSRPPPAMEPQILSVTSIWEPDGRGEGGKSQEDRPRDDAAKGVTSEATDGVDVPMARRRWSDMVAEGFEWDDGDDSLTGPEGDVDDDVSSTFDGIDSDDMDVYDMFEGLEDDLDRRLGISSTGRQNT